MMSLLAAATVLYAAVHLVALRAWWRGDGLGRALATTLPWAGLLALSWVVYQRTDAPGWQVLVLALVAAVSTLAARTAVHEGT